MLKIGFYQAVFQMVRRKSAKPGGLPGSVSSHVPIFAVFYHSILDISSFAPYHQPMGDINFLLGYRLHNEASDAKIRKR